MDFGPRAANSHWASVGSAPPRQVAYASASHQVMQRRGRSGASPGQVFGKVATSRRPSHFQPCSDQSASFV